MDHSKHIAALAIESYAVYTIQAAIEGESHGCNPRYLGYQKGSSNNTKVFLNSGSMKYPPKWRVRNYSKDQYIFETADREGHYLAKLSYSSNCRSSSVMVLKSGGRLRWRLIAVDAEEGLYRIIAAGKSSCQRPYIGRLSPSALQNSMDQCGDKNGVKLLPVSRDTQSIIWRFTMVAPAPKPPPPPSPPPPPPQQGTKVYL